ncbi:NUDIX hydrolase [Geobacter hydrogenophilus]|uniref:DNA mismatch repair protein MutT n=1 Tax=Geobacter hydrogenophilus TaxID=40983 RepID=A0A9W6G0Q7_9BACT|nr:NUDIX hydrolase [Geobacter hydrogenophilus]MBT0893816.1 NUDIX hydrolase [Geobacter hydrogenophilus]GLI38243.1 DNA mismatch repair protein MutT [Geobacter hydrogenophilus]
MADKTFKKDHIVTSVVAVIVDDENQVLLTKRNVDPFKGEWVMPGGKIDLGEPIIAALQREVMEEVGLQVEVDRLVDVFEHVTPGDDNYHFIILYYLCRPLYCDIAHNLDEVEEARWVPRSELGIYRMPQGTRFILGKLFPELCSCEM